MEVNEFHDLLGPEKIEFKLHAHRNSDRHYYRQAYYNVLCKWRSEMFLIAACCRWSNPAVTMFTWRHPPKQYFYIGRGCYLCPAAEASSKRESSDEA